MDSSQSLDKWQRMSAIVMQYSTSLPDQARQFQKLFIRRLAAENLLVFLLQYLGLMLSTLTLHPMPLWLASGSACGFVFLRGYSVLPGIFAGSFFACYFAKSGLALGTACAATYTLQAFLLVYICRRYISPSLIFYRKITFAKFILHALLLTAAVSWALEFFCYKSAATFQLWIQWWLADFDGILVFSCALIALDTYFPQIETLKKLPRRKLGFFYGLLIIFSVALLASHTALLIIAFALSAFLLTVLISKHYAWCGAITAIFLLGFAVTLGAFLESPLFANQFRSSTLIFLQLILILASLLCYVVL